ncbi:MAG: hypothetical protein AAF690_29600 [Acidobacteriota bacterium]
MLSKMGRQCPSVSGQSGAFVGSEPAAIKSLTQEIKTGSAVTQVGKVQGLPK